MPSYLAHKYNSQLLAGETLLVGYVAIVFRGFQGTNRITKQSNDLIPLLISHIIPTKV